MGIRQLFAAMMVCLTLTWSVADARPLSLNEITEGVCRVTAQQGSGMFGRGNTAMGSGTVVGETQNTYYVLTNAHVVGNASTVKLEFWRGGRKTVPLNAKVIWKRQIERSDIDFAVCEIDKSAFGKYPPRVIPLAPKDYRAKAGYYICAVGCDSGRWARGWEGYLDKDENTRIVFTPSPVGGQSGSGVMVLIPDEDGELHTRVGAILTWRTGHATSEADSFGAAIPAHRIYDVLGGNMTDYHRVPVSWVELSANHCAMALCSNGRLYPTYITAEGRVACDHPVGTKIIDWNYNDMCNCPYCGGNHGTPSQGPFGGRLNPFQAPAPNPNPGGDANPYGTTPPDITSPWPTPGGEDEDEEEEDNSSPFVSPKKKISEIGFFGRLREKVTGFGGGLAAGLGLWMLGLVWSKFLRKRVVQGVDTVQDRIEKLIRDRHGKEAGKYARELMEGVEESLLAVVDSVIETKMLSDKKAVASMKGKLAGRVTNGETEVMKASKAQILAAIAQAEQEAVDPNSPVTPGKIQDRAKEILREADV